MDSIERHSIEEKNVCNVIRVFAFSMQRLSRYVFVFDAISQTKQASRITLLKACIADYQDFSGKLVTITTYRLTFYSLTQHYFSVRSFY